MKYRVDRFEGVFVILEYDTESEQAFISVLRNMLPENLTEGDILVYTETGWELCREETDSRRQTLAERRRRMLRRN